MDVTVSGAGTGPETTSLGMPGSRALVVGTGSHAPGSRLPDLPAVERTVAAVSGALVERCGLDPEHVRALTDPADPKAFLNALTETATRAEDVLLLYYIGHGLVSLGGELYLATRDTRDQDIRLAVEALSYATVREALTGCRARAIMVVLDCCFSGRAAGTFGAAVADAFELTYVRGSFLLSAASATEQALAPEGDAYTAFSGALLDLLRDGDPAAPRYLTFEDAYRHLARVLPARGMPAPHRRAGDRAGELLLAVNPAAQPVIRPRPERPVTGESALDGRPCPYPGLSAFGADDARYFFGRAQAMADALGTVATRAGAGPVALVGRSGSGKTSLLQAGLLPAIKSGRLDLPGSRDWPQVVMTPAEQPLATLAARLAQPAGLTVESARTRLAADPAQLGELAGTALRHAAWAGTESGGDMRAATVPSGLVVCVDQFEELFTLCSDEQQRRAFIQSLCAASRPGVPQILVILGIRADFYAYCMAYPELGPTLQHGQIPLQPMAAPELRAAIEGPADAAGLVLEDGLTERLLHDLYGDEDAAGNAEGALPLLAYALQATWMQSDARVLTLTDYQATGGIWKAVTLGADRTYASLDPAAQQAARTLLLRMVRLGEGTEDVRRRISMSDLLRERPAVERAATTAARDALVAARLITVADDDAEITHEALLRAWPRLHTWINEDRSDLLARQRIGDAARTWDAEGRDAAALYSGARLELARRWLRNAGDGPVTSPDGSDSGSIGRLEREFLRASIRAARARSRRGRAVRVASVVIALVLVATGVYALQQRARDRDAQAVQTSVQLATEADTVRVTNPAAALWLSLAAYRTAPTPQARSSLYDSYVTPFPVSLPGRGTGAMLSAAYSPDGRTAAGAWADGTVRLWRVTEPLHPALIADLKVSTSGRGSEVAFSPDGHLLAVHTKNALQIWDVRNPARQALLSSVPLFSSVPTPSGQIMPLAFSPNGRTVATGNADGRFRLWDVIDPRRPVLEASLSDSRRALQAVAFSPSGQLVAVASAASGGNGGGRVRLWDVTDSHHPVLDASLAVNSAEAVAFSPVGHLLVAVGAAEDAHAWNVGSPGHPSAVTMSLDASPLTSLALYSTMDSIAFRPGSQTFVTTDSIGQTEIWTADGNGGLDASSALPDPAGTDSAAFSPSGQDLLTGDLNGSAQLWTMLAALLPGQIGPESSALDISTDGAGWTFGHDGTLLAANALAGAQGKTVGSATLWDVSDPLRPTLDATFRGSADAAFLPDGHTIVTFTPTASTLMLWDVTDPRHPVAGATLASGNGDIAVSDSGLLAVSTRSDVIQVWDVRNFRRPVLDSTITGPINPSLIFLDDQLLGIVGFNGGMRFWELANARRPVEGGLLPDVGTTNAAPGTFLPPEVPAFSYDESAHILTTENTTNTKNATLHDMGLLLWNLANPSTPKEWKGHEFGADPDADAWIDGQTLAGATGQNDAIDLWDVRYPEPPQEIASEPIGAQTAVRTMLASPNGSLLAAGLSSAKGDTGDVAELWQVAADHRSLSEFAQLPGDSDNIVFSPRSQLLATNLSAIVPGQLAAFISSDNAAVLYPLDTGYLYQQLCALPGVIGASQSGQRYLSGASYRKACS